MDNEVTSSNLAEVGIENFPGDTFTTTPPQEYIVRPEHTDGIPRLMDSLGENAPLTPEERKSLVNFEERLIQYEKKAIENGKPVGIDYFANYKPGFKEKFVAAGGAAALAVLIPIVLKMQEGVTYIDQETGEEKPISLFYTPDGKKGSEVLKFQSMDPSKQLSEEQKQRASLLGKLPDDPRIIKGMKALRKASLDEAPQALTVGWGGVMNVIGPRSLHRMADRLKTEKVNGVEVRYDLQYPEIYQVFEEAMEANVTKGIASGYTAVARGQSTFAQAAADAILMRHASQYSENFILGQTLVTALSGKGAK